MATSPLEKDTCVMVAISGEISGDKRSCKGATPYFTVHEGELRGASSYKDHTSITVMSQKTTRECFCAIGCTIGIPPEGCGFDTLGLTITMAKYRKHMSIEHKLESDEKVTWPCE